MSYAYVIMKPGQAGAALTVAPYVVFARRAAPESGFHAMEKMSLGEWEKAVGS